MQKLSKTIEKLKKVLIDKVTLLKLRLSIRVITWKEYNEIDCANIAMIVYSHWLNISQLHEACSQYFIDKNQETWSQSQE